MDPYMVFSKHFFRHPHITQLKVLPLPSTAPEVPCVMPWQEHLSHLSAPAAATAGWHTAHSTLHTCVARCVVHACTEVGSECVASFCMQ